MKVGRKKVILNYFPKMQLLSTDITGCSLRYCGPTLISNRTTELSLTPLEVAERYILTFCLFFYDCVTIQEVDVMGLNANYLRACYCDAINLWLISNY